MIVATNVFTLHERKETTEREREREILALLVTTMFRLKYPRATHGLHSAHNVETNRFYSITIASLLQTTWNKPALLSEYFVHAM